MGQGKSDRSNYDWECRVVRCWEDVRQLLHLGLRELGETRQRKGWAGEGTWKGQGKSKPVALRREADQETKTHLLGDQLPILVLHSTILCKDVIKFLDDCREGVGQREREKQHNRV